jgi:hypothetical protein
MEVSGQLHAPAALSPGKDPLDRRLGGLQRRSRRGGEQKNSQSLPGLEPILKGGSNVVHIRWWIGKDLEGGGGGRCFIPIWE